MGVPTAYQSLTYFGTFYSEPELRLAAAIKDVGINVTLPPGQGDASSLKQDSQISLETAIRDNTALLLKEGTAITGVTMPTGGASAVGWLSALYGQLNNKLPALVSGKIPVDLGSGSLSSILQEGTDITGAVMPAGGASGRGWLSAIYGQINGKLPALVGGKIPVDIGSTNLATDTVLQAVRDKIAAFKQWAAEAVTSGSGSTALDVTTPGYTRHTTQYTISSIVGTVTVRLEGSCDGTNWFNLDPTNSDTSHSANGTFAISVSNIALYRYRFRFVSGNATINNIVTVSSV